MAVSRVIPVLGFLRDLQVACLSILLGGAVPAAEPCDLLLEGGRIVDGTGNPWFPGDVAVRGTRIVAVGRLGGLEARRRIDCRGLVVAPGFIDIHSHSDLLLLEDGSALSKVLQGVTTEVLGEGDSAGPSRGKLPPGSFQRGGKAFQWSTLGGYLELLERSGISVNVASYVGEGTVWRCVMGNSFQRPTPAQLEEMKRLVSEAMEDGAFGLSSMLAGPPGYLASTADLVELARAVQPYGGVFSSHIRNEGQGVLEAVREAIEVGERAGVPVDIIHLKIADQRLWGRMGEVVEVVEAARSRGVPVQANVYPYTRGHNNLASIIPPWAHEGGKEALLARLRDGEARLRMKRGIREDLSGWYNHFLAVGGEWSRILVSGPLSARNQGLEGLTMDEVLRRRAPGGVPPPDPFDGLFDFLIEEEGSIPAIYEHHSEPDMNLALRQSWCSIGSDGSALAAEGPLRRGRPHPRSFGTFPRVLGVYARERRLLGLEEAVRKMTSLNASKLGIVDRGILRPGCFADITVFDPERVKDRATYVDPFQYSQGIEWVVVNGTLVIEKGRHTGRRPGRSLRKERPPFAPAPPAASVDPARPEPLEPGRTELRSDELRALIVDNEAHRLEEGGEHRAGYSGVAGLYHGGSPWNLFVPAYSGLNFEHIWSGASSSYGWDIFEPRKSPMALRRLSERRVELRQERTQNWPLESVLTYEIAGAEALDFTLRCTPRADAWRKHGFIGLFFASYIQKPEDMAIHFIGHGRAGKGDPRPRWIRHLPPRHGEQACHRACSVEWDPPLDPDFRIPLASGHSDLEYDYPFYYGLSHGKVFILMFERPRHGAEARFAQSPSGGGEGNPAWDFLFLKRGYEVGREFQFRARAVYRDFHGRADVTRAYEEWSGERVEDPGEP